MNSVGKAEQTRAQLAVVAERLFAERGIEAVSLREIGATAGQRNNSVAQYHFGGRQGLIDAIFELRMAPIDRRRHAMLDEMARSDRLGDVRALCEALVLPLVFALDEQEGYCYYARFLAQVYTAADIELLNEANRAVTGALRQVTAGLDAALPELPSLIRRERIALAAGLVVHSLADRERNGHPRREVSAEVFAANLVDSTVGLLCAPVATTTRLAVATYDKSA
jgi:AcrR family transcriptional regulator